MTILDLTTREFATAFWLVALLGFAVSKRKIRGSLCAVLKSALHRKILVPVILLALYIGAVVWALEWIGLWERALLKDTLVWFALVGVILPFSFVTGKYEERILARLTKESIGVLIVVEFLIATYTFPLPVELVLLPGVTFIGMMDVMAESKPEYAAVKKLTGTVLALFGFTVAAIAIRHAIVDYRTLGTSGTLHQFLLPIALSLSLGPYIYVLLLYVVAEDIFIRVGLGKAVPNSLKWYALIAIVRYVGLRPHSLRAFFRTHVGELLGARSRADIDSMFLAASPRPPMA